MLTKKSLYGLQALSEIGAKKNNNPILISTIAKNRKIPKKFLESILLELKKQGILDSKIGRSGGYFFKIPPHKIPLTNIIRLLNGPIAFIQCASLNFYKKCANCDENSCKIHSVFCEIRDATLKVFDKKTVADIINT